MENEKKEKQALIAKRTKEIYAEKTKKAFKELKKYIGDDVDASLGVLFCIEVMKDIMGSGGPETKELNNNLIAKLGEISFVSQMEAIKEIDMNQYLTNCAVISGYQQAKKDK